MGLYPQKHLGKTPFGKKQTKILMVLQDIDSCLLNCKEAKETRKEQQEMEDSEVRAPRAT